jgi:hypothetical protein
LFCDKTVFKNTLQKFSINNISINITISDSNITSSTGKIYEKTLDSDDNINKYKISYEFDVPKNFNLDLIKLDVFNININSIYDSDNMIPLVIEYALNISNKDVKDVKGVKNIRLSSSNLNPVRESFESSKSSEPSFFNLYITIGVSILICIIVYIIFSYRRKTNSFVEASDLIDSI